MNKMIIGLCGPAGSGKDTIADYLVSRRGFVKMANADLLKRVAKSVFGFNDAQLWGPSELRNASDPRYPRDHGPFTKDGKCRCCGGQALVYTTPPAPLEYNLNKLPPCFLTPRFVLQSLGTEWGRMCYPTVWVERLLGLAQELQAGGCFYDPKEGIQRLATSRATPSVVFTDVRFRNEVDAIKNAGGKVVRVVRGMVDLYEQHPAEGGWISESPSVLLQEQTSISQAAAEHASETELLTIPRERFDYVFQNSGDLGFLRLQAARMMDVLQGRIMSFDRGLQDAPPFLRGECKKLATTMSALSQKYFQSEWHDECASRLWYALQNRGELGYADHDTLPIYMSEEELKNLKELSDMVPGWFSWKNKTYDAPYFMRRGDWLEEYAKRP